MFPYMNNSSSYPLYYNQSPSFTSSLEANNISFQHQQELYSNYMMPPSILPPISENPINTLLLEGPINLVNDMNISPLDMNKQVFSSNKRATAKRDRHTKISTAQGVRDRRVRLSISIARDFFNLQDMLGFDKASKTLGWLLDKSKAAIEEITRTSKNANNKPLLFSSFDTNDLVAQNIGDNNNNGDEDEVVNEEKDLASSRSQVKRGNCNDQSLEKAIRRTRRAKARDRARERTKSKKTINDQIDHNVHVQSFEGSSHHHLDQQQRVVAEQNLMFHTSISGSITPPTTLMIPHGMMSKGVSVGEAVVVKSKAKETLLSLNYNNNYYDMITKDYDQMGYNNNYHNDHHHNKFELLGNHIIGGNIQPSSGLSALNIINNLSTEICINAKSWDTNYSNHQNLQ